MNQPPRGIQDLIYSLEEGAGKGLLKYGLLFLLAIFIGVVYHLTEFRNFTTAEAMDSAQIGRRISEGHGFTTQFIRPLSLHLLQNEARSHHQDPNAVLKLDQPDLSNPPIYPLFLAGWMKILPFRHAIPNSSDLATFRTHQPDVLIGFINVGLFLLVLVQTYLLARKLFDPSIAKVATAIVFGTELLWRFTYSGLSTNLCLVFFLGLLNVLVNLEHRMNPWVDDEKENDKDSEKPATLVPPSLGSLASNAIFAGALLAALCLTRYATGILIIPVIAYLIRWGANRRWQLTAITSLTFLGLLAPWLIRNHNLCGTWFGTASYAIYQDTPVFEGTRLLRSQNPDLKKADLLDPVRKLFLNSANIFVEEIPKLGGGYVTAFFLVGLLIPFNNSTLQRLRWFVLASLVILAGAQAIGRTHLSHDSPVVNSENLLVLLTPATILFGVALFYLLLDRIQFILPQARTFTVAGVVFALCLPMVLTVLPPGTSALAFPPYDPRIIQQFVGLMGEKDLVMTDMPWAVAWYGRRDALWNTLRVKQSTEDLKLSPAEDLYNIHDNQRAIRALYLSPITADAPWRPFFLNFGDPDTAWNRFYMDALLRKNMPDGFPLKHAIGGEYMSVGHLFLSDSPRWMKLQN